VVTQRAIPHAQTAANAADATPEVAALVGQATQEIRPDAGPHPHLSPLNPHRVCRAPQALQVVARRGIAIVEVPPL
jgi:hypothetical protein